jgi:hypothetical protein
MTRLTMLGLLTLLLCAPVAAADRSPAQPASYRSAAAPAADDFAQVFVVTTNAYASSHGDPARISHADCVSPSRGRYMCSYKALRPNGRVECHLMQARWTPQLASSITVTLAGRVKRCGTLRQALRSLG